MLFSRLSLFLTLSSGLLAAGTVSAGGINVEKGCWDDITALYEDHLSNQPHGKVNTYIICSGIYNIGKQYGRGECCKEGDYPLIARSNTHYKCGHDGKSKNGCVFVGGDTHVLINDAIFDEGSLEDSTFEGFTFRAPERSTSFAASPGEVRFIDCIFEEQSNEGPILAIYDSGRRRLEETRQLLKEPGFDPLGFSMSKEFLSLVHNKNGEGTRNLRKKPEEDDDDDDNNKDRMTLTFEKCLFQNNKFAPPVDILPTYGVVSARSPSNTLAFEDCIFRDNVYGENIGYAISVDEGSNLFIKNTCFVDNEFNGFGVVQVYDNGKYEVSNNYGTSPEGLTCKFLAFAESQPGATSDVTCVEYDALSCTSALANELEE